MFLTLAIVLSFLSLYYYRATVYRLFLSSILFILKLYINILNVFSSVLPRFIFIKMYIHKTNDSDFTVHEYYYNQRGRFHKFKMIETVDYDINDYFNNINVESLYDIHHACVLNKDGEYKMDITKEIREFMHLRNIIEWKYLLIHMGIEDEEVIVVHKNDDELSEKILYIKEIYNNKFDF